MLPPAELSPLELSAFLNALPCSLAFHRDASFEFKDLIKEVPKISMKTVLQTIVSGSRNRIRGHKLLISTLLSLTFYCH